MKVGIKKVEPLLKPRINSRKKGQRNELRAKKILEAAGYEVEKTTGSKFGSQDFWGLFDLLAMSSTQLRLVQVKTNYCRPEVKEAIKEFPCPPTITKEVWVFKDRVKEPIITVL
jgi:copper chaperone CopZ